MRLVVVMVGCVLLMGLLPTAAALAQTDVALQAEDLPLQYDIVGAESQDIGRQFEVQRTEFSKRSATDPGPTNIASYVVVRPVIDTANLPQSPTRFRQAPYQAAMDIVLARTASDLAPVVTEISGPAIGQDTRWFRAEGSGGPGAGTLYAVVFGAGDGAAALQMWSPDPTSNPSDLLPLAATVAGRLVDPPRARTPFAPVNRSFGDEDL
jgi:hypothetical protein